MDDRTVQMHDPILGGAGTFLQVVDVLGEQKRSLPAGEDVMGTVRLGRRDDAATPCVPCPNPFRVASESLDGREFHRIVSRPEGMIHG